MTPLVILGSRLIDGLPGATLTRRLVVARRHITPASTVVVTGHNGEAEAMRDWLVTHGVDPARIIVEPHARSTNENLENASVALGRATRFDVVTSDFHAPRVRMWAWHHHFDVNVITASTPANRRLFIYTRELAAISHSAARILWRKFHSL
ncbi:MAG: YdcF family protein [Corynebacterium glucuronolyticum]|nr:YdcF family protein [Corynebacterium glucuronolyticum]MDD7586108.1 YdcF family protein [Mycobacteriaceae bacterium]MDY5833519.1 YdcF family protein [Corynebacterium glucuronolyticum]